jgi:Putative transposase
MKRLVRQGVLVQEQDQWYVADGIGDDTDTSALRPLQQGSIVYRFAFGPRAGRKVLTLREVMPVETDSDYGRKPLCANEQGFSLHVAVRCHANERLKLDCLCRYITRPALANDRVKINPKGQVELKQLRIVAVILLRQAIEKILNHLGLEAQPPPRAPARRQVAF